MTAAMLITAGRAGGDFDGFVDYMGRPIAFGYGSHNARHVIMVEGRGDTGQTVEMMRTTDGFTQVLKLRGADGSLLADFAFQSLGFNLFDPRASADRVLDYMMDKIQSGVFGGGSTGYRFVGNGGADRFTGRGDADTLTGAAGNDMLAGGGGADSLAGGLGDDTLTGGNGADRLNGDGGADVFVCGTALATAGDRIRDFKMAEFDRIDLRQMDAIEGTTAIDAFTFIGAGDFGGHAGELRLKAFANATGVQGDTDGDGKVDFMIEVNGVFDLDATAFLLI